VSLLLQLLSEQANADKVEDVAFGITEVLFFFVIVGGGVATRFPLPP